MRALTVFALLLHATHAFSASDCRVASGSVVLPLVELYTSEGCDSCPAADRWLTAQFPAGLPAAAAVLAFHVDYWDRLGWKDRFASPAYTARQHQSMRANRASFVYTPQVVLQGRDFSAWRQGAPTAALASAAAGSPRADIVLRAEADGAAWRIEATVTLREPARAGAVLALAYTDSRLVSAVTSGENRGVTLIHDHVVRSFETRTVAGNSGSLRVRLQKPGEAGSHAGIVAFAQDVASGAVLQSVVLPLAGCAS